MKFPYQCLASSTICQLCHQNLLNNLPLPSSYVTSFHRVTGLCLLIYLTIHLLIGNCHTACYSIVDVLVSTLIVFIVFCTCPILHHFIDSTFWGCFLCHLHKYATFLVHHPAWWHAAIQKVKGPKVLIWSSISLKSNDKGKDSTISGSASVLFDMYNMHYHNHSQLILTIIFV